ncbi:hypothetical protein CHS0354_015744 [Potamilus streckersoni]|uniref:Uncharacterized protein n=1 Tax=Potamilus streckersoni TaxID=2493646 RepID=A0AAE0T3E0_9BIVA|nr:hypothetical protein CHS0354_015744 [Potamilus streckersoni]
MKLAGTDTEEANNEVPVAMSPIQTKSPWRLGTAIKIIPPPIPPPATHIETPQITASRQAVNLRQTKAQKGEAEQYFLAQAKFLGTNEAGDDKERAV